MDSPTLYLYSNLDLHHGLLGTLRRTGDECESALAALLECDLEKLGGAGTIGESGVALASLVEEQLLRTA